MPMKVWNCPFIGGVLIIKVRVVEEGNELEKDMAVKRLVRITINNGGEMTISQPMQMLEKSSTMSTIVPIQAMAMFVFDWWISATSMLLSDV